jgi:hypothetical protein
VCIAEHGVEYDRGLILEQRNDKRGRMTDEDRARFDADSEVAGMPS